GPTIPQQHVDAIGVFIGHGEIEMPIAAEICDNGSNRIGARLDDRCTQKMALTECLEHCNGVAAPIDRHPIDQSVVACIADDQACWPVADCVTLAFAKTSLTVAEP